MGKSQFSPTCGHVIDEVRPGVQQPGQPGVLPQRLVDGGVAAPGVHWTGLRVVTFIVEIMKLKESIGNLFTLVLLPDDNLSVRVSPDHSPVYAGTHTVSVWVKTLGTSSSWSLVIISPLLTSLSVSPGLPYLASMSGWKGSWVILTPSAL